MPRRVMGVKSKGRASAPLVMVMVESFFPSWPNRWRFHRQTVRPRTKVKLHFHEVQRIVRERLGAQADHAVADAAGAANVRRIVTRHPPWKCPLPSSARFTNR